MTYKLIDRTTLSRIYLTWLSSSDCFHTFLVGSLWKTTLMIKAMESFNTSETSLLIVLQIIYVTRNPKDVMVSYYHFSKFMNTIERIPDFNIFMERFLSGKGRISFLLWSPNLIPWPQTERRLIISININYQNPQLCCNLNSKLQRLSLTPFCDESWSKGSIIFMSLLLPNNMQAACFTWIACWCRIWLKISYYFLHLVSGAEPIRTEIVQQR